MSGTGRLLEGPDGYGPAPEPGAHLREAWDTARTPLERLRAGLALCQTGDLSVAGDLAADLYAGTSGTELHAAGDGALLALQHQHLVMCLLTAEQADGPGWRRWCTRGADGDLVLPLAAGGRHTLTAPMLEWYLTTADRWRDGAPFDWYEHALDSVADLSGVVIEAWDEDVDPEQWRAEVRAAGAAAGASYVHEGRPLTPGPTLERAVAAVARHVAQGHAWVPADLEQLGTWTGLLPPRWPAGSPPGAADLAAVERYAEQVAALPWRPGTKYFYGHDVDGGPGLGTVPTR